MFLHDCQFEETQLISLLLPRSHPWDESRSEVGEALRDDPTNGFERESATSCELFLLF